MKKFTLYWTNLDRYEKCPRMFLWYRGWGTIDLGRGPGKGKDPPFKSSRHHAVMGIVIADIMERLYNDELWRNPQGLREKLLGMVDRQWAIQTAKDWNYVDYRIAGKKEELLQVCRDGVSNYLRTMKAQRLLGEYARAELELLGWINKYNPIGGRADLVFRRPDTGITIMDGKNSTAKGEYTDPDQLRWYALCFYLAYREMPNRLGFIYFRYPYGGTLVDKDGNPLLDEDGKEQIEQGVEWVNFTKDDLKGLAHRAVEARKGMEKENFDPNPVPKVCKWCDFETVCDARQEQKDNNRRKNPKSIDAIAGAGEVKDFTF